MTRTVIWKLKDTISRANGKISLVQSKSQSEEEGEKYIEKLEAEGEEIVAVNRLSDRIIITLK